VIVCRVEAEHDSVSFVFDFFMSARARRRRASPRFAHADDVYQQLNMHSSLVCHIEIHIH